MFDFSPGSATVGDSVNIHIKVDSNNPGATKFDMPCGGVSQFENTTPDFNSTWNTNECPAETVTIRVCSRSIDDPNWQNLTCLSKNYTFSAPAVAVPTPSAKFWTDATTIKNGECTYLHWETSNANSVDIDGDDVAKSGNMQVCPKITKHYSLKAKNGAGNATRSLTIVVGSASGNNDSGDSQQGSTGPDTNSGCPAAPSSLSPGKIAVVAYSGSDKLRVRVQPNTQANIITKIGLGKVVTVIAGPKCSNGYRWWEIGFDGVDGWAVEVGNDNEYYLVLNGQPIPNQSSGTNDSGSSSTSPNTDSGVSQGSGNGLCSIDSLVVNEGGVGVWGSCTNNAIHLRILVDGSEVAQSSDSPLMKDWTGINPGQHTIRVEVKAGGDKWTQAVWREQNYTLVQSIVPVIESSDQTQSESTEPFWCGWWVVGWLSCDLAEANSTNARCEPQCMTEMRDNRPDMNDWSQGTGNSDPQDVLANAQKSPIFPTSDKIKEKFQVQIRNPGESPEVGDLIIWQPGCGGANKIVGHIGQVKSVDSVMLITVHDANWDNKCTRADRQIQVLSCMRFVTLPFPAGNPPQPKPVITVTPTPQGCGKYQGWQNFACQYIPWLKP